jgi:glycosyltransferase involved in cell wall biosynthesis
MAIKLSGVILTKNEEKNIERCLKSLDFCDEIIIIDDYSSDGTLNQISKIILRQAQDDTEQSRSVKNQKYPERISPKFNGAGISKIKIYQKHLNGDFAAQRNFGMERAAGEWVLFVDADEKVTVELKEEILRLPRRYVGVAQDKMPSAFCIKRRDWFWGREVRFGEIPRWIGLIRLVRKNSGKWEGRAHEKFKVQDSRFKVKSLKNYIKHYPHLTVKEFLTEINFYSSLRVEELFQQGKKTNILEIIFYPLGKFFLNYFLKLGFLDGTAGFVYALMMSFHSFLVRAKLYTLNYAKKGKNAKLREI